MNLRRTHVREREAKRLTARCREYMHEREAQGRRRWTHFASGGEHTRCRRAAERKEKRAKARVPELGTEPQRRGEKRR